MTAGPPTDEAPMLALLVEEFLMTEGQVLLRSDASGARRRDAASFPADGLRRRVGPEAAERIAALQHEIAGLFDARPGAAADIRERVEAAGPAERDAVHRAVARDPFFRDVARRAVEVFLLFYPTLDRYVHSVHPGAAENPAAFPKEAEETRTHYRLMEASRAWLRH